MDAIKNKIDENNQKLIDKINQQVHNTSDIIQKNKPKLIYSSTKKQTELTESVSKLIEKLNLI